MEITISVSEKTAQIIRRKAEESGKNLDDFATVLFEEKVSEDFSDVAAENSQEKSSNPFAPLIGKFAGRKTDTSERMHEILYSEDFDPAEGFSIRK